MSCTKCSLLVLTICLFYGLQDTYAQRVPPLPYVIEGACPFECCTYGEWKAGRQIPVYSNQKDTTQILFNLETDDEFQAVTGFVVVMEPGLVSISESYELYGYYSPENGGYREKTIKKSVSAGDTLYVLSYRGEGEWNVWYRGDIYQEDGTKWRFGRYPERRSADEVPATLLEKPETEWWVKISTSSGTEGWILMNDTKVYGHDECGY